MHFLCQGTGVEQRIKGQSARSQGALTLYPNRHLDILRISQRLLFISKGFGQGKKFSEQRILIASRRVNQ